MQRFILASDHNVHTHLNIPHTHMYIPNKQEHGIGVTTNNLEVVEKSQVVWLAVKPHAIGRVLREVSPVVRPDQLILSTAAGIPLKELEKVSTKTKRLTKKQTF